MEITVGEVMREIRCFFAEDFRDADWRLDGGRLTPELMDVKDGWIAVRGSRHNDGVWQVDGTGRIPGARDEEWTGRVWRLNPPGDFLALCREIAEWSRERQDDGVRSERFGEYSVQHAVMKDGLPMTWQAAFKARLTPWRGMFAEVSSRC